MSKILSDSNIQEAEKTAKNYAKLLEINNENQKILDNYKKNIFNIMRIEKITKVGNVKLTKKNVINPMPIHEIKECFNGEKILDNIVVEVNIQATLTYLKIKLGMNESTARKALNKLLDEVIITIPELEVLER